MPAAGVEQLVDIAKNNSTPTGAIAVVLQNPRVDSPARANIQQRGVRQLKLRFSDPSTGVAVIDVNSAFPPFPELATDYLRPEGIHPTAIGSQVFADTIAEAMQLREVSGDTLLVS